MADYIAVVNGTRDSELVAKHYARAAGVRLPLERARDLVAKLPNELSLWIDGGIDGLHRVESRTSMSDSYMAYIKGFSHGDDVLQKGLAGGCGQPVVTKFVGEMLSRCASLNPRWISVPQVPYDTTRPRGRMKFNRQLLTATREWQAANRLDCNYMLPVLLHELEAMDTKTRSRNDVIKWIDKARGECSTNGIWVVNSALEDERGSQPNQEKRFPGLVAFHSELRDHMRDGIRIVAGPYWAMNIILWARNLIDNPVIGIATGYRYYVSGGKFSQPTDKVAIPPLLRRASVSAELKAWMQEAEQILASSSSSASGISGIGSSFTQAASDLASLSRQLGRLRGRLAHEQVAGFYKDWLEELGRIAPSIRALALRQQFSAAHVVGSVVGELPKGNQARQAGRLAQQFMLSCL